jgi:ABC-2 type transport system ATP-binding protein
MIAASHLIRRFGSRIAVNDLSLEINRSEIVALLGPNGAGKTTTLRMLAGVIAASSGTVTIDGIELTRATGSALRARIGFLTESPGLWERLTVRENLAIYAELYALANAGRLIDRMLDELDLRDRAATRTAELSKGMRQKVTLARALLHNPPILLLDEPTSGLDPEITRTVRRLLAERRAAGCAILVSTHNLDEAERIADRVAVLQERLIAVGPPAVLRQRLTTGRVLVRVAGDPSRLLKVARKFDPEAAVDGPALAIKMDGEPRIPALVSALVAAGGEILEVRQEMPALEDVYVHLLSRKDAATARPELVEGRARGSTSAPRAPR